MQYETCSLNGMPTASLFLVCDYDIATVFRHRLTLDDDRCIDNVYI